MSRSRRLRKKLFLHDFAVYGFSLTCKLTEPENEVIDKFIDEYLIHYLLTFPNNSNQSKCGGVPARGCARGAAF